MAMSALEHLLWLGRLPRRVSRRVHSIIRDLAEAVEVQITQTYCFKLPFPVSLNCFIRKIPQHQLPSSLKEVVELNRQHYFDLLGSGWTEVRYGMECRGLDGFRYEMSAASSAMSISSRLNRRNRQEARRVRALIDDGYNPIDWQLDFKSGFRWKESKLSRRIRFGRALGADIKVPWELARMQHLPPMALAYGACDEGSSSSESKADSLRREFKNQFLDFIAANPPRFGANWACTMDVAIRAANCLIAYDLFTSAGARFDDDFLCIFTRSIYEHGLHIVRHLEWQPDYRGNHYLANVVGLLFVAAYLPSTPEVDGWLALAVQELVREVKYQFAEDGANLEASVCYHRLSAEMVLFATALLSNLPLEKRKALDSYDRNMPQTRPSLNAPPVALFSVPGSNRQTPFPEWYWERLEKMAEFTMHLTKPDGFATQFGDNDSGRFFKLGPAMRALTPDKLVSSNLNLMGRALDEADLDHRHLVAGINALFSRKDMAVFAPSDIGAGLVSELAGGIQAASYHGAGAEPASKSVRIGSDEGWDALLRRLSVLPRASCRTTVFPADGPDLRDGLELFGYPDFGAYIFRSPHIFLALRCGSIGQGGIGGHAHLDQLTLELVIDGRTLVADPGTYLYTPLPAHRNAYRSARAHFVPRLPGREPGDLSHNLFRIDGAGEGECLYFGPHGFAGRHFGYGEAVYRLVTVETDRVVVRDFAESGAVLEDPTPENLPFSPGYGKLCRSGLG